MRAIGFLGESLLWALVVLGGLVACSSEDSTASNPGTRVEDTRVGDTRVDELVCWVPESAPSDLLDCTQFCARLRACEPDDAGCDEECPVFSKYLEESAAQPLLNCVQNSPCGEDLLFDCMESIAASGELAASPEKMAECASVQQKSTECEGPVDELLASCDLFAVFFTQPVMEQIGTCGAEDCGDLRSCLETANCMFEEEVPRGGDGPDSP